MDRKIAKYLCTNKSDHEGIALRFDLIAIAVLHMLSQNGVMSLQGFVHGVWG